MENNPNARYGFINTVSRGEGAGRWEKQVRGVRDTSFQIQNK